LATAFPELDADGQLHAILGWLTDVTHRKLADRLIAQQLAEALENKRQTENFIDMTSHEMRNPLSAIMQSADAITSTITRYDTTTEKADILLSAEDTEDILDATANVILCAQHQKRIVDDILTLSKLDASLLAIVPNEVQPPSLIHKALEMYDGELRKADITAELSLSADYSNLAIDFLLLDPDRFLQVVINLLTNAVKFTKDAKVRKINISLHASHERPTGQPHGVMYVPSRSQKSGSSEGSDRPATDNNDIYLEVAVHDTGKGLTQDEMRMLFQRFKQANPKTYSQYGGSGLGLFISRILCEMQGGQIGVASGEAGTVFAFFVQAKRWQAPSEVETSELQDPLTPATEATRARLIEQTAEQIMSYPLGGGPATSPAATAPNLRLGQRREMHVLIVEDNLINQKILSKQLQRMGCIVHVADHGLECLAFLSSSTFCAGGATPLSLILLDLEMPVMDGLTCIGQIRAKQLAGEIAGHVPVIAITANARSEQISAAVDAGIDVVVTKPFRMPELMMQMEGLITASTRKAG
jgi:signal transduction histidine kinase/AmiR/NasT family two-component response regulator